MTLLHWSLKYMFYSRLATTAGFPVQTDSNTDQLDSVWSPRMTSDTLSSSPSSAPCQAVLVKNPELQVLSNACLLLPPGFPSRTTPPKAGRTSQFKSLWKPKPHCHMCVHVLGKWVTLAWMGVFLTQALTLGSTGTTGNLEDKNHLSYSFYSSSPQIKPT